jgi:phage terminase large subunit
MEKEFKVLKPYGPLFHSEKTYFLISGGRASGKSTQAAAFFLIKLMGDDFFRGVIARYTQKSIKSSIYRDILDMAQDWNILQYLKIDGDEITNKVNGNMIITHAMKLADGTMQAKGKGLAKVTHLLIDEATELPSEEEFIKLNDSFRTKGIDRKIFILFNPTTKRHWIHNRWYVDGKPNPKWSRDHEFIHTTYHINTQHLDPKKILEWEEMKHIDIEYYNHHILGDWSEGVVGRIFTNWQIGSSAEGIDETWGLDFGFASDPAALIRVRKHNGKLYLKEFIYETNLTNDDIHDRMLKLGVPKNANIIADSAEPKSIEELKRKGWKVQNAYKGPDSIQSGISKIKQFEVYVDQDSENLLNEYALYCWKAGSDKPIDSHNHAIDAVRYALSKENIGQYAFTRKGVNKFMPD